MPGFSWALVCSSLPVACKGILPGIAGGILEEYIGPHSTAHLGHCSAMCAFRPGFLLSCRKEGSKATPLERMEGSFSENMVLDTHIRVKEGGGLVENTSFWLPTTPTPHPATPEHQILISGSITSDTPLPQEAP